MISLGLNNSVHYLNSFKKRTENAKKGPQKIVKLKNVLEVKT